MKTNTPKIATLALLAAAMLAFTSCSTMPERPAEADVIETKGGAIIVETFTTTATVTAIDASKRKVTLVSPDGAKTTYKAGPKVNFGHVRIGDRVKATVTEEVAVFLRKDSAPPSAGVGAAIGVAVKGAKPGGMMAETQKVTARMVAVDAKQRKVTLQFADGRTKKLKVGKQVNLANVKPGDNVVVQVTEALVILVEKP